MSTASERLFLIVRAPNGDVREFPLTAAGIVLGRDDSADIRVEDKKVSRRHAAFKMVDGRAVVEDLGSSNGVRLNGKKIDRRATFSHGDQLRVAGYLISLKDVSLPTGSAARPKETRSASPVADQKPEPEGNDRNLPKLAALDDPVRGSIFVIRRGENIIGRLEECDVPVLDGSVSRQHARVVFAKDRLTVTDLGSSNGTFIGDRRIETAELAQGDILRVGNIRFRLELPPGLTLKPKATPRQAAAPKRSNHRVVLMALFGLSLVIAVAAAGVYWNARYRLSGVPADHSSSDETAGVQAGAAPEEKERPDEPVEAGEAAEPKAVVIPHPTAHAASKGSMKRAVNGSVNGSVKGSLKGSSEMLGSSTATSPFGRRGPDGLPLDLPEVDTTFDFEAFVQAQLAAARDCKDDVECTRREITPLLERDPINAEAKALLARANEHEKVVRRLREAEAMIKRGEHYGAYEVFSSIPETFSESEQAKKRASEIRADAAEDALMRAEAGAEHSTSWVQAHVLFSFVLAHDPGSTEALNGIRALEKKMREKRMEFVPFESTSAPGSKPMKSDDLKSAILAQYEGDAGLAKVAHRYSLGDLQEAKKMLRALMKKARGTRRKSARDLEKRLEAAENKAKRARTEISNDPFVAWGILLELVKIEREILPEVVKSFLLKELEVSLADAFAGEGESLLERAKYEESFQAWAAGQKLDPTNPRIRAGLNKLEEKAEKLAKEAERAMQRGDKRACDTWKQVTRMTRQDSEAHKLARTRALEACAPRPE